MSTSETSDLVHRLLDAAAANVAECPFCWLLATGAPPRPMGPIARQLDPQSWSLSFITDGRSQKAQALRRSSDVSLLFKRDGQEAYAELSGRAKLVEDRDEVGRRWRRGYDPYFPAPEDRGNATFLDVRIARMSLWIRGVTPEPFGLHTTTLERDEPGDWRLA